MPTLQEQINATPSGGMLNVTGEFAENIVINKPLTLIGAKIVSPNADPAVSIPPRTRDVTLRNCEIAGSGSVIHAIVEIGLSQTTVLADVPTNITLDHCDIHGHAAQEVQRGVAANGANVRILNSRIYEIHGLGYDTQAICCWNGPGPFKIIGNYLEASGENVMFGGSPAAIQGLIPTDIEVRGNWMRKPLSWYPNDPSYAGRHWSVKNLFELKNARRVVVEGNIFEGNWTDAQAGRAIVFTPRPSDSGLWAVIEDVEFKNNIVKDVGSGILILGHDEAGLSGLIPTETRLRRVRVANNLWLIDGPRFASNGWFVTVIAGTEDAVVEHNTAIQTGQIVGTDYDPSTRFVYRDNISRHNEYGIFGSGKSAGNSTISYYFPDSIILNNVIAKEIKGGSSPSNYESIYPTGNFFPETLASVGFIDLTGGNLRLSASSPYKGKATDGKDPGCDFDALEAAQGGTSTPTPVPQPVPTPVPTPTPTPTPTPDPAPIPSPDTSVPVIAITSPVEGATVSGRITVTTSVIDAVDIGESYLVVDGAVAVRTNAAPGSFSYDTAILADGNHSISVRAWKGGMAIDAKAVNVIVKNAVEPVPVPPVPPAPPPAPSIDAPKSITVPRNGSGEIDVSFKNLTEPVAVNVSGSDGQVAVSPLTKVAQPPSSILAFKVRVKKQSRTITFTSSCGVVSVRVNIT